MQESLIAIDVISDGLRQYPPGCSDEGHAARHNWRSGLCCRGLVRAPKQSSTRSWPFWICTGFMASCLVFLLATGVVNAAQTSAPAAGNYCPDAEIAAVRLEELTVALDAVMGAEQAASNGNTPTAELALSRAAAALKLSSARGEVARTALFFDAVIAAKVGEDYTAMLGWFPSLHTAVLGLPDDPRVRQADSELSVAESILRGERSGNGLQHLRAARDLLSCDQIDLPTREAHEALNTLYQSIALGQKPQATAFSAVTTPLGKAIKAALKLTQRTATP